MNSIDKSFLFAFISTSCFLFFYSWLGGDQLAKFVVALFAWLSLLSLPKSNIFKCKFDIKSRWILAYIFVIIGIVLFKSIFLPEQKSAGNKYLTLFGNPYCLLMMVVPVFSYLGNSDNCVKYVNKYVKWFLLIGFLFMIKYPKAYASIIWFLPIFVLFFNKYYKFLSIAAVLSTFYTAFLAEDTYRTNIVILLLSILIFSLTRLFKNKNLISIFCYTITLFPLFYAILALLVPEFSVFQYIVSKFLGGIGNEDMTSDTRSFLFRELAEDLTKSHNWLLGRGPDGQYFSFFFFESTSEKADHYMRLNSEVTLLMNLLRGGILYVVGYYGLLFLSMIRILNKAKSLFMLSVAMTIAAWICVSTISNVHGFELMEVLFFTLVGCGLSKQWLERTDGEIKRMLK